MRGQVKRLLNAIEGDPLLNHTLRARFGVNSETGMGLYEVTEGLRRLAGRCPFVARPMVGWDGSP